MKIPKLIIVVAVFITVSCSTKNIDPVVYDVPNNLKGNAEVELFLSELASAGGEIIACKSELGSDASFAKKAKSAVALSKATSAIKDLKEEAKALELNLNDEQKKSFEKVIYRIEVSVGQMRLDIDAIDESDMVATAALKSEQKAEIDKETAEREQAIAQMKEDGTWKEPKANSSEIKMPKFMHILFPILIFGAIIFSIVMTIRKKAAKFKEISYSMGEAKDALKKAQDMVDAEPEDGRKLSKEEKAGLDFLNKHLNK